jgi:hypothetical protein
MLERLPNDSLPNANLRTRVLKVIQELPVESRNLMDSKAGKILVMLEKSKEELEANKQLIRDIKAKWARVVCGLYINYAEHKVDDYEKNTMLKKRQQHELEKPEAELLGKANQLEASKVRRMKRRYDFVTKPASNLDVYKFEKSSVY